MRSPNADEISKARTIDVRVLIDNILIWLFWGSANFFSEHGHPLISDICYLLFFICLTAIFAFMLNTFWPHPKIISGIFSAICVAFGTLVFWSTPWPSFSSDFKFLPPILASMASGLFLYATSRLMKRNAARDQREIQELRSDLEQAKQAVTAMQDAQAPRALNEKQKESIVERLRQIGPEEVEFWIIGSNLEIARFCATLEAVFVAAGWTISNSTPFGMNCEGVVICIKPDSDQDTISTAEAVFSIFESQRIAVSKGVTPSSYSGIGKFSKNAILTILVGAKPA